ncbi:hypothetical protein KDU71_22400 [Carboxylicivirga sediminis]|uniref:Uncharacterized protein n=1 Tax=Carboxylicivirga sediminis TaxID=2006564 RepID=A0A941FCM6_9BACT|nr:hypothetical protein [Carboxylicivirga sediminis]MBR8538339.1 hypothetical protein [Carboxylicivirga sediminis]
MSKSKLDRLNSCNICKKRKLNEDNRAICSLTDAFAEFNNECKDFSVDIAEYTRLRENLKSIIKEVNAKYRGKPVDLVGNDNPKCYETPIFFAETNKIPDCINISKNIVVKVIEYLFFAGMILGTIYLTIFKANENIISSAIIGISFSFLFLLLAKTHLIENTQKIILDYNGMEIIGGETTKHFWKDIIDVNILTTRSATKGGISYSRRLIIDNISSEIFEYPTQDLLGRRNAEKVLYWAKKYHEIYWDKKIKYEAQHAAHNT